MLKKVLTLAAVSYGVIGALVLAATIADHGEKHQLKAARSTTSDLPVRRVAFERTPTQETASAYVRGLLAVRDYDTALKVLSGPAASKLSEAERLILTAEAYFRLRRYEDARETLASITTSPIPPEILLMKAKSAYATSPLKAEEVQTIISTGNVFAAGGPVAAEAWLLRARMALDENALDDVAAAVNRARDHGVSDFVASALLAERELRRVDLDVEASLPGAFGERAAARVLDHYILGLKALRAGAAKEAVRNFDSISDWLAHESRGDLLLALAKMENGDHAQAALLVSRYSADVPTDWVAADLERLVASRQGDTLGEQAASLRLERLNPKLTALYCAERARLEMEIDQALDCVARAAKQAGAGQSGVALLAGEKVASRFETVTPAVTNLASFLARADGLNEVALRQAFADLIAGKEDALTLALVGEVALDRDMPRLARSYFSSARTQASASFRILSGEIAALDRLGEMKNATELAVSFHQNNPEHLPGLILVAERHEASGDVVAAVKLLTDGFGEKIYRTPDALLYYAKLTAATGRLDDVAAIARKAVDVPAKSRLLGRLFALAGDQETAARHFREALIQDPTDEAAAEGYFAAMKALGRERQARALLGEVRRRRFRDDPMPHFGVGSWPSSDGDS